MKSEYKDLQKNDWDSVISAAGGSIRRLDYVKRFGGVPVMVEELVSSHSYWVTINAAMFHRLVAPNDLKGLGAVVMAATMHDAAECVTGDVNRLLKYSTPELKKEIDRAEGLLMETVDARTLDLVHTSEKMAEESDSKYVEVVVKAADILSVVQYMKREAMRGNKEITPYYHQLLSDLKAASERLQDTRFGEFRPSEVYDAMLREARLVYGRHLNVGI